jgi:DNA-binding winged helix-turn-helix (wHTH) protein
MRGKTPWILIVCSVVLFSATAAVSIFLYAGALQSQFAKSVEWLSHAFSGEVSHYITVGSQDERTLRRDLALWAEKVVQEYLLYAQVIKDGKTLAESKAPQVINLDWPAEPLSSALVVTWERLPDGMPYLNMLKTLELSGGIETRTSYLRLGISLTQLNSAIWIGTLIIAFAGLIAVLISSALILYFSGVFIVPNRNVETVWAETAPKTPSENLGLEPAQVEANSRIQVGELVIDDGRKAVRLNGLAPKLSPREYDLLKLLASEPDRVFSDQEIIAKIWPENSIASADDVRKYIRFLRRKLEKDPTTPQIIVTVKGFGYKLQAACEISKTTT